MPMPMHGFNDPDPLDLDLKAIFDRIWHKFKVAIHVDGGGAWSLLPYGRPIALECRQDNTRSKSWPQVMNEEYELPTSGTSRTVSQMSIGQTSASVAMSGNVARRGRSSFLSARLQSLPHRQQVRLLRIRKRRATRLSTRRAERVPDLYLRPDADESPRWPRPLRSGPEGHFDQICHKFKASDEHPGRTAKLGRWLSQVPVAIHVNEGDFIVTVLAATKKKAIEAIAALRSTLIRKPGDKNV
ncbi:hypothetical protein B0H66DRAFT_538557 [Apodospora peruviana]|uniref:Uncharacterized protein n=1 Tax=Apodospora peruviana TaxID=516989 RepID=A0AAE0LYB9_9PEZI|nr:hypothetical protein B0H66DRAFT_538557 [Apodospora peruviana]